MPILDAGIEDDLTKNSERVSGVVTPVGKRSSTEKRADLAPPFLRFDLNSVIENVIHFNFENCQPDGETKTGSSSTTLLTSSVFDP